MTSKIASSKHDKFRGVYDSDLEIPVVFTACFIMYSIGKEI